ncbi:Putative chaperone required for maturation of nitric oxide reductase [gamma proteobacterium HdN1]|nr:Putative chaperone required for maturation of nitric oxide reductase [gamma proteobacterium HdN1]
MNRSDLAAVRCADDAPAFDYYEPTGNECEIFEQAYRHKLPLLIKGPTGCGKTRFVIHMAQRLGLELTTVACHDDLSAADLVGRHLITAGETRWSDGPLTRVVRNGGICYLDEIVEARKDTTVVLHPLTDDRRILPIDRTGEQLLAPDNFMLVVSYNPGYQNALKSLKPSTRQRFLALQFNFPPPAVEARIVATESGVGANMAERIVALAGRLRTLAQQDLEEAASTRLLVYTARLIAGGMNPQLACEVALIEPLSDDAMVQAALREVVRAQMG